MPASTRGSIKRRDHRFGSLLEELRYADAAARRASILHRAALLARPGLQSRAAAPIKFLPPRVLLLLLCLRMDMQPRRCLTRDLPPPHPSNGYPPCLSCVRAPRGDHLLLVFSHLDGNGSRLCSSATASTASRARLSVAEAPCRRNWRVQRAERAARPRERRVAPPVPAVAPPGVVHRRLPRRPGRPAPPLRGAVAGQRRALPRGRAAAGGALPPPRRVP